MAKLILNNDSGLLALGPKLIKILNTKNYKLKIESVEENDLKTNLNLEQKRTAIIVNEFEGVQHVLAYVFFTTNEVGSRNSLVSQSIFPDLIKATELLINSPSFTLLNHPIYYINVIDDSISANTILRDFALLSASGFHYIELFQHNVIDITKIPQDINKFVKKYYDDAAIEKKHFELNETAKTFKIKVIISDLLNGSQDDFNGSEEKFFWTQILFISIIAAKSGFQIDFDEYENFINTYEPRFSTGSKKMLRCKTILNYLKKLQLKKYYHEL